jgi:enamine deaminase RidA (YjgF/YER057c/UK114 family)
MKKSIYLIIGLTISLTISLNGQVINNQGSDKMEGINRKSAFNLEEIKVRWKKVALENCTGVPCTTASSCTAGTPSSSPTITFTSPSPITITPITIATTGATGIGTASGLPPGISATWAGNVITISGTVPLPTGSGSCGTFNYSIPLAGSCSGLVNATGTIVVSCPA